jgi:hypothetical protein
MYDTVQNLLKFLLHITTLVSAASIIGSDTVFIVVGRSFTYIMNSKRPRIDPWGTLCCIIPKFQKNLSVIRLFY